VIILPIFAGELIVEYEKEVKDDCIVFTLKN
jgi:hypothetical protein